MKTLSPDLIELNIPQGNGWLIDEQATTLERTVLYYSKLVSVGATTTNVIDTLNINPNIQQKVTQTSIDNPDGSKTITTSYAYDGYQFCIEVKVDSVQEHNAEGGIYSAWGRRVTISNGTLTLL